MNWFFYKATPDSHLEEWMVTTHIQKIALCKVLKLLRPPPALHRVGVVGPVASMFAVRLVHITPGMPSFEYVVTLITRSTDWF